MTLNRDNLRTWQKKAAQTALNTPRLLLGAQPGAGKTITTLTFLTDAIEQKKTERILLIGPRTILDKVWRQEAQNFDHTKGLTFDMAHQENGESRSRLWFNGRSRIVTCTTDLIVVLAQEVVKRKIVPFDTIVVDESQAFKSPTSERTKALFILSSVVKRVVLLSGTPTPNGVIDAYSPGFVLSEGGQFWGDNFFAWRGRYFEKKNQFMHVPRPNAPALINKELSRYAVSIKNEDAADIPAALFQTFHFEFSPGYTKKVQKFMNERTFYGPDYKMIADSDGAFLMVLHQLTQGFIYRLETPDFYSRSRIEALEEVANQVEGPILIGIKFRADVQAIKGLFPKAVVYNGGTPLKEREQIIDDWNEDRIPVLLGSPSSMGHGLNLQKGSSKTLIWYANPFSWEHRAQMNARLVRSGQKNSVSIISLCANVGLDAAILAIQERKKSGERLLLDQIDIMKKDKS